MATDSGASFTAPSRSPISAPVSTSPPRPAQEETGAFAQATPVVRFDHVSSSRGPEDRLRSLSFALAPGSFHMLTGPSGSGKTSMLRLICVADRPSQGVAQVFGRDVATLSRKDAALVRRRIGSVLYPLLFVDHLSVWDNAALVPRVIGRDPADYGPEVDAVLKWMGLARSADAAPATLAPDERHRLAMARAVVNRPEILLLDEPSQGLEAAFRERALKLAGEIHGAGATVVMVSRDEAFAAQAGHPILRLQDGRASIVEPGGQ
ncbi:MAG: cell division ATP-binding protein FtsE [Caulobacteraceae bacterium]